MILVSKHKLRELFSGSRNQNSFTILADMGMSVKQHFRIPQDFYSSDTRLLSDRRNVLAEPFIRDLR